MVNWCSALSTLTNRNVVLPLFFLLPSQFWVLVKAEFWRKREKRFLIKHKNKFALKLLPSYQLVKEREIYSKFWYFNFFILPFSWLPEFHPAAWCQQPGRCVTQWGAGEWITALALPGSLQNSKTRVGTALSDRALNALNENEQRLFRTRTEIGANKSKILQKMLWVHKAPESNCKGKSWWPCGHLPAAPAASWPGEQVTVSVRTRGFHFLSHFSFVSRFCLNTIYVVITALFSERVLFA